MILITPFRHKTTFHHAAGLVADIYCSLNEDIKIIQRNIFYTKGVKVSKDEFFQTVIKHCQ